MPLWPLFFFLNLSKNCLDNKNEWYDVIKVYECMDAQNPYFSLLSFSFPHFFI